MNGALYPRGDGGSCAGGLPDMKSFRSFTGKGAALKELIYSWNSHHVCAQTHPCIALTHQCLRLESCSCYEISQMTLQSHYGAFVLSLIKSVVFQIESIIYPFHVQILQCLIIWSLWVKAVIWVGFQCGEGKDPTGGGPSSGGGCLQSQHALQMERPAYPDFTSAA